MSISSEEFERTILDFIKQQEGSASKNTVVAYMTENGLLSRVPTLDKINELERSGRILVIRGKNNRRGQAHFLSVNDRNAYNKIDTCLTEINDILNGIDTQMDYFNYYICGPAPDDPHSIPEDMERSRYLLDLHGACHTPIVEFLHFLYLLTNRVIGSEKDSQFLNQRIVELHLKSTSIFSFRNKLTDLDAYLKEEISSLDRYLEDPRLRELTDGTEIDLNIVHNLREGIEKLRKEHIENFTF